jgi:hypothetical protein
VERQSRVAAAHSSQISPDVRQVYEAVMFPPLRTFAFIFINLRVMTSHKGNRDISFFFNSIAFRGVGQCPNASLLSSRGWWTHRPVHLQYSSLLTGADIPAESSIRATFHTAVAYLPSPAAPRTVDTRMPWDSQGTSAIIHYFSPSKILVNVSQTVLPVPRTAPKKLARNSVNYSLFCHPTEHCCLWVSQNKNMKH